MSVSSIDSRGWQVGKSLKRCFADLFANQMMCDIDFNIHHDGKMTTISAHKLILSARSPVFEAMFSGNFAESQKAVDIVDADPADFCNFLRYLYCEEADVNGENALHLMKLGKKYFMDNLVEECSGFIAKQLDDNNVCHILDQAIFYSDDSLIQKCIEFAWSKPNVLQIEGFNTLSYAALLRLVKAPPRMSCNETSLIEAILLWAKSNLEEGKTTLRSVLGDIIYTFRLGIITVNTFTDLFAEVDVFTEQEQLLIFYYYLSSRKAKYEKQLVQLGFDVTPETCTLILMENIPPVISNFTYGSGFGFGLSIGYQSEITIRADKAVQIKEFGVYGEIPNTQSVIHIRMNSADGNWIEITDTFVSKKNVIHNICVQKRLILCAGVSHAIQVLPRNISCANQNMAPKQQAVGDAIVHVTSNTCQMRIAKIVFQRLFE